MRLRKTLATCALGAILASGAMAENLVILHTNDMHSNVRPEQLTKPGGMVRVKVAVDSIRRAEPYVMLLDAGDDVQGQMYFTLFKGEVEYEMMNRMGYDAATIGNHEFDNGIESLADNYRRVEFPVINANYGLKETALSDLVKPYIIRNFHGKRFAVIGVGANPNRLVIANNYKGMTYRDPMALADSIAGALKADDRADYAIVLSHIGYRPGKAGLPSDSVMALSSSNIDLILGGHSHTSINPATGNHQYVFTNKAGKNVLVAQNRNECHTITKITIDLDDLQKLPDYELLPIDSRYDGRLDAATEAWLKPYDEEVARVMAIIIGSTDEDMQRNSTVMKNWAADAVKTVGERLSGVEVDAGVTNSGGLRSDFHKGELSLGEVYNLMPFDNNIVVLEMNGALLQECLDNLAMKGGQCVSRGISFTIKDGKAVNAKINGKKIDKNRTYRISTISYIYEGNDDLVSFAKANLLYSSDRPMKFDIADYVKENPKLSLDHTKRITNK